MIDKVYDLFEEMEEELEDAEKYALWAAECAKHNSSHASTLMSIAEDELKHFEKLGEILKSYKGFGEDMQAFIEKKHSHMLKKHAKVKYILANAR
jgi:thioesterase domain-containing protein